jgi:MFS family permease
MVFMLGRFSEIFIVFYARDNFGLEVTYGTAMPIVFNLISTFVSYPIGRISDKVNRLSLLVVGFLLSLLAHSVFVFANSMLFIFIGSVIWGAQSGMVQNLLITLVSDYAPKDLSGTCFGVYYIIVAAAVSSASVIAGAVSQNYGGRVSFVLGAGFSVFSIAALLIFKKFANSRTQSINKN